MLLGLLQLPRRNVDHVYWCNLAGIKPAMLRDCDRICDTHADAIKMLAMLALSIMMTRLASGHRIGTASHFALKGFSLSDAGVSVYRLS